VIESRFHLQNFKAPNFLTFFNPGKETAVAETAKVSTKIDMLVVEMLRFDAVGSEIATGYG